MTPKGRVSPFRNLRIKGCSHLPIAYRRVPRLSSPLNAKAFTKCPSYTWERHPYAGVNHQQSKRLLDRIGDPKDRPDGVLVNPIHKSSNFTQGFSHFVNKMLSASGKVRAWRPDQATRSSNNTHFTYRQPKRVANIRGLSTPPVSARHRQYEKTYIL